MASRAMTREGINLTEPVELEQLNKSLPDELVIEEQYLDILKHNTLVKCGVKSEPLQLLKSADSISLNNIKNGLSVKYEEVFKTSRKRKKESEEDVQKAPKEGNKKIKTDKYARKIINNDSSMNVQEADTGKLPLLANNKQLKTKPNTENSQELHAIHIVASENYMNGCPWSTDWSCAYDVVFMSFWNIYLSYSAHVSSDLLSRGTL